MRLAPFIVDVRCLSAMKFSLPGQLRGSECRRVISQAVVLRRRLESWFAELPTEPICQLGIILRIDGSLGSFGPPGVENFSLINGELECDLVVRDHDWAQRSDDEINEILSREVLTAIASCLSQSKIEYDHDDLQKLLTMDT